MMEGESKKRRVPNHLAVWVNPFLDALRKLGNVAHSSKAAGIDRGSLYRYRARHPDFARRWQDAIDEATDVLELEARRRAVVGVERPVYQGGKLVGSVREFSDLLLIFLLKANRPEKYRDTYDVRHSGSLAIAQSVADLMRQEAEREAAVAGVAAD